MIRRLRAARAPRGAGHGTVHAVKPTSLVARALAVRLGSHEVVHDLDLDVRAGEVLALVGPNGAGKSSLLAALAGDLPGAHGTIHLADRELARWSKAELARRRAILPQSNPVAFAFTVDEVARMGWSPWHGTPRAHHEEVAVARALERVDLLDLRDRRITALSGGERARVALARVLIQDAAVLLLDEPTAALDLKHQELVLRLAREEARRGVAVAVVLHDLALAAAHADRIAVLDRGRLRRVGPPWEVLAPALLSEVYGHPIEVLPHPGTGVPLVLPAREQRPVSHHSVPNPASAPSSAWRTTSAQ